MPDETNQPEPLHEFLANQVSEACRNQAPHGWIADYIELFCEYPGDKQTFEDYLRWQLDVYNEDPEVNPPEYAEAITEYLREYHQPTETIKMTVDLEVTIPVTPSQDPVELIRERIGFGSLNVSVTDVFRNDE